MAKKKLNVAAQVQEKVGAKLETFESVVSTESNNDTPIVMLNLSQICTNPDNRDIYSTFDIEHMKESILKEGLLSPLIVRPHPDGSEGRYRIISGENRYLACTELNFEPIPCQIREDIKTRADEHIVTIHANLQRDKTPVERAKESEKLIAAYEEKEKAQPGYLNGKTPAEAAAQLLGLSTTVVRRDRRIASLIPELHTLIEEGSIAANAAENFADMTEEAQREIVKLVEAKAAEGETLKRDEAIKIKNDYKAEIDRLKTEKAQVETEKKLLEADAAKQKETVEFLQKQLDQEREKQRKAIEAAAKKATSKKGSNEGDKAAKELRDKLLEEQTAAAQHKIEQLEKQLADEQARAAQLEQEKAAINEEIASIKDGPSVADIDKVKASVLIDSTKNQLRGVRQSLNKLFSIAAAIDPKDLEELKTHIQMLLDTVS